MRDYNDLLKKHIRDSIYEYRIRNNLSQRGIADVLREDYRSYFDQEHEKYSFSALTLMFFLIKLSDSEITKFIRDFQTLYDKEEKKAKNEHSLVYDNDFALK